MLFCSVRCQASSGETTIEGILYLMSDRITDSTIKGFLYQFNKTILEIANADDEDIITVEGVVEDVDILSASGELEAIQYKYHESKEKFTPQAFTPNG